MRSLRILTWHVHGAYLESLGHAGHELVVPVRPGRPEGYGGRPPGVAWPDTIREVPAEEVAGLDIDAVLFQSARNYLVDQFEILSERQRRGPRIYVEHDPPREHPTDTRHVVDDPEVLLVHVTAFNELMWDAGPVPTRVIEHGVAIPVGVRATGELARGVAVVNDLPSRGRRLGADLFTAARRRVPLDLVGMGSEAIGGLGEVPRAGLPAVLARYRFYFHPVRYTSLGMALCEAMMVGLPVVGLATTELPTVVVDGDAGYVDTNPRRLVERMETLLADPGLARRMGRRAREVAVARFGIDRFAADWDAAFRDVVARSGDDRARGRPEAGSRSVAATP